MKILKKTLIGATLASAIVASSAFAQMEVEVGGKVEAQVGFRGRQSTAPYLVPSELRPQFWNPLLGEVEEWDSGVRGAIVTDSLIDIWATGTYDYECLGRTTYGAKIELFADPSANKYSMDDWHFTPVTQVTGNADDGLGFIPGFIPGAPIQGNFIPFAVVNPGPAREVKIYLENCLGKFEIGDTYGATKHLQVDAATVAVGSGGIEGDSRLWATPLTLIGFFGSADMITNKVAYYYVDPFFAPIFGAFTASAIPGVFPATFISHGVGTEMRYTGKASYYTPRYAGFVAGISYIPDTDVYGAVSQLSNVSRHDSPFGLSFRNVVEGGINYDCKINEVGVKASILGETGETKEDSIETLSFNADGSLPTTFPAGLFPFHRTDTRNLRAYEFGLGLDYCGFAIAGSYGTNRRLLEGLKDNRYWTIGAGYTYAGFGISVNYMDNRQKSHVLRDLGAEHNELKYREFVVDAEYRICEGFIPYVSYAHFNVHQPFSTTLQSKFNQGIGLIGLKVLF